MKFATVRDLRLDTKNVLAKARREGVVITYRGKPWAVMQKMTDDDLEDFILTHHPKFRKALEKSVKEKQAGKVNPLEDVARELGIEL